MEFPGRFAGRAVLTMRPTITCAIPVWAARLVEEKSYQGYITDNMVGFTIEGIKQFTQPFFMMLQFFNDHRPFDPPHKYEHLYDQTLFRKSFSPGSTLSPANRYLRSAFACA